ncbi:hypothetical protein HK405_002688 [Cladochytrium tenue]|nr:hypothetical protein HK405_002688 [Cladochytrium tenue]
MPRFPGLQAGTHSKQPTSPPPPTTYGSPVNSVRASSVSSASASSSSFFSGTMSSGSGTAPAVATTGHWVVVGDRPPPTTPLAAPPPPQHRVSAGMIHGSSSAPLPGLSPIPEAVQPQSPGGARSRGATATAAATSPAAHPSVPASTGDDDDHDHDEDGGGVAVSSFPGLTSARKHSEVSLSSAHSSPSGTIASPAAAAAAESDAPSIPRSGGLSLAPKAHPGLSQAAHPGPSKSSARPAVPAPSRSVFNRRRRGWNVVDDVKTHTFSFRLPLFALIFLLTSISTVAVGIIGWQITNQTAQNSVSDLASVIQSRTATEILSSMVQAATVATKITSMQRSMFETGQWSFATDTRNKTMADMLLILKRFQNWWEQYGHTRSLYDCDADGNILSLYSVSTTANETDGFPGNNGTLFYGNQSMFGYQVDFTEYDYTKMGPVYLIDGEVSKTSVAVAHNDGTGEEVLVANDWSMFFIISQLQGLVSSNNALSYVLAVEAITGRVIATSNGVEYSQPVTKNHSSSASPSENTTPTFDILDDPFINSFKDYLLNLYPSAALDPYPADAMMDHVMNNLGTNGASTFMLTANGKQYLTRMELATVPWDEPWVVTQFLDIGQVLGSVNRASYTAEILVLTVIAVSVVAASVFAFFVGNQLRLVARRIKKLREVGLSDEIAKQEELVGQPGAGGGGAGGEAVSFVRELKELQFEFFGMTRRFVDVVKRNRQLHRGATPAYG